MKIYSIPSVSYQSTKTEEFVTPRRIGVVGGTATAPQTVNGRGLFGKWEILHNSKFRESDVILLTDDLHAPLDGVACSNGRTKYSEEDAGYDAGFQCKFRANTTLCLKSEKYGEWHEWDGFDVTKTFTISKTTF